MHPETTHASPTPGGTATPGQPAAESLLQAAVCAISLDAESTAGNVDAQLSTSAVSSPGLSPPRKRESFSPTTPARRRSTLPPPPATALVKRRIRANERGQLHLRSAPPFPVSRTADLSPKSARSLGEIWQSCPCRQNRFRLHRTTRHREYEHTPSSCPRGADYLPSLFCWRRPSPIYNLRSARSIYDFEKRGAG